MYCLEVKMFHSMFLRLCEWTVGPPTSEDYHSRIGFGEFEDWG